MRPRVAARTPDAGMAREELRQHIRALARAAQNAGQSAMLIAPEWILEATMEDLTPRLVPKDEPDKPDRLVSVRVVASRLHASVAWVYCRGRRLPFVVRDPLRPRALLFSERGLDKHIADMAQEAIL